MRKIDQEELKEMQLQILKHTANFCDAHNIRYWIDCGTLLGAVRHKGYIPWDDDIDIGMLREDYDNMISCFNRENHRYKLECLETRPDFYLPYAKIVDTETILYEPDENGYKTSVNIDIFVYDNAPTDQKLLRKQFDKRDRYRKLYAWQHHSTKVHGNILRRIFGNGFILLLRLLPSNYFIKKMVANCKRYKNQNTKDVGNFAGYSRQTCSKDVFDSFLEMDFEGIPFKVPVGYDQWLRSFYGDYMQLPPIEERVSHHSFVAYAKENGKALS